MQKKAQLRSVVQIRETECIGCTKCIEVCPVDAISGSAKHMHTVITSECTGCKWCIPACPVDCIDVLQIESQYSSKTLANHYRKRFNARERRLATETKHKEMLHGNILQLEKKNYIKAAIARVKEKRKRF